MKLEMTQISESRSRSVDDIYERVAKKSAERALSQLEKVSEIEFDPQSDVDLLDQINVILKTRLNALNRSVIIDMQTRAVSREGDTDRIDTEDKVASAIQKYTKLIQSNLQLRRELAGQMSGNLAAQNTAIPKVLSIRKAILENDTKNLPIASNIGTPVNKISPTKA